MVVTVEGDAPPSASCRPAASLDHPVSAHLDFVQLDAPVEVEVRLKVAEAHGAGGLVRGERVLELAARVVERQVVLRLELRDGLVVRGLARRRV